MYTAAELLILCQQTLFRDHMDHPINPAIGEAALTRHLVEEVVGSAHEVGDAGARLAKGDGEPHGPVHHGPDAHVQPVLDQDVHSVLRPEGGSICNRAGAILTSKNCELIILCSFWVKIIDYCPGINYQ